MTGNQTNWAGNVTFAAADLRHPSDLAELQRLVAQGTRIRTLGTGHSFNRIADTTGDLVSVAALPRQIDIDTAAATVTLSAGLRYGELATELNRAGRALRNLGSLPHISVAGSCATGTHGSGDTSGTLATSVRAWEMVTAEGDLVTASREDEHFAGTVVALGALGVVTRLTLDTVPSFDIRQYVYEDLPRDQVTGHFDEIFAAAYSVSLFTDWRGPGFRQAWLKCADTDPVPPPHWMGGHQADGPRNPVPGMPPSHCTQQLGVPGPWHERLLHFRLEFTPSAGDELQSEYLLPRASLAEALAALDPLAGQIAPVLRISEIRTVAADELWLSPCYRRACVAFHFTWIKDWAAVSPVLAQVEERLAPLAARPHWGKLFHTSPAGLYPRREDFRALMRQYDPAGKFRNDFVERYICR